MGFGFGTPQGCPTSSNLREAEVWESLKDRIFRIKPPPPSAAARVGVCSATAQWNLHPSFLSDPREGCLQIRSRCGLEKTAIPKPLRVIQLLCGRVCCQSNVRTAWHTPHRCASDSAPLEHVQGRRSNADVHIGVS